MEFADFWKLYPRKVAKKDAEKAWSRLSLNQQAKAIETVPLHAKCWCAECRETHCIPHAATWLNGERFEDEIEIEEPINQWWKSNEATMDYGRKKGIQSKPGEGMESYRQRLRAA